MTINLPNLNELLDVIDISTARLGARLGLGPTPTLEALLAALAFGA